MLMAAAAASAASSLCLCGDHDSISLIGHGGWAMFRRNTRVAGSTPLLAARAFLSSVGSTTTLSLHQGVPCHRVQNQNTLTEYELCEFAGTNISLIPGAAAAAAKADTAVLFLGLSACNNTGGQVCDEGEGRDRHSIGLPATQLALLQAVVAVQPRTVLVLINGGALSIQWAKEKVPAIVEAYYPGEAGGEAIAAVLWGRVSPAGRLPFTVPQESFTARDMLEMDLRAAGGVTGHWMEAAPCFEFGAGGSYTTWAWAWAGGGGGAAATADAGAVVLQTTELANLGGWDLPALEVRNTGAMDADIVSLGFVSRTSNASDAAAAQPSISSRHVIAGAFPIRALFDFARTTCAAGASETLRLRLPSDALSVVIEGGERWLVPAEFKLQVGERSGFAPSLGGGASIRITLDGPPVRLRSFDWPPM